MLTITNDASSTRFSDRYQQTYHSTFGARTESSHVFLHGSGVYERLSNQHDTRVLEIGFGLGLNCLLCADCATSNKTRLFYTGIEHMPISATHLLEMQYGQWLDTPVLETDLALMLANIKNNSTGNTLATLGDYAQLRLNIDDATSPTLLSQLAQEAPFDAIFLDAFSPDVNPECWTRSFFEQLRLLLTAKGRLATYCVKGSVRRNLVSAGFMVHKYQGPAGKREVLWASPDERQLPT